MTDRRAAAVLAGAVVLAAAYRFSGLGFYNDDYAHLAGLARAAASGAGLLRGYYAESAGLLLTRPLELVLIPASYALFGQAPTGYHALSRLLDLAVAWQFFRWLESAGAGRPQALLAALFFALYPNHDAARCWPSGLVAQGGLTGTLWALRLAGAGARAASAAVFLAAMLFYEAPALLFLCAPLLAWLKDRRAGLKPAAAAAWPLAAAFLAGALYQRLLVPLALSVDRHPVSLSFGHALKVLGAGFEVTFANRLAHGLARGAQAAAASFSALDWAAFAFAAAALAAWAFLLAAEAEPSPAAPLLPLAGALFALGYAPYFFDAAYMPEAFSANNRLNLTGSLGGALFFAWAAARWRRGGPALAGVLAAAFLLGNWASNGQYADAYSRQQEVLAAVEPLIPAGAKTLLLYGVPERVGSAVVFESTFDFEGALSLRGKALKARVGQGRMHYEEDAAVLDWYGRDPLPYEGLYAYDHRAKRLERLPDAAAALAFAARARI